MEKLLQDPSSEIEKILRDPSAEPCYIPLQYLRDITDNFSCDQELGKGGFGVVYRVRINYIINLSHLKYAYPY